MKNDENINSMNYTKGGWNTQFMNTPKCKSGQISYIRIGKEYQCCMPKQNPLNLNPPNYPPQEIWNPYILPDYQGKYCYIIYIYIYSEYIFEPSQKICGK